MKVSGWWWRTSLCVVVLMAWVTQAKAQECLMGPASLPGLAGPPTWFNPGTGNYRAELHDPRWAGAPYRLFASTGSSPGSLVPITDAAYRVLEYRGYLYVQYQALVDSNGLSSKDRVFLTFKGQNSDAGWGVRIDGDARTPPAYPADPNIIHDAAMPLKVKAMRMRTYSAINSVGANTNWVSTSAGAAAPWLENVAVWQDSPGVAWAVTFRIKLTHPDIGLPSPLTVPLKVAHAMRIDSTGGVNYFGSSTLLNPLDSGLQNTPIAKDSTLWQTVLDAAAPVCTAGITLSSSDFGVWTGSSLIGHIKACGGETACPPPTEPGITNRFRVTAHNVPDPHTEKFAVRANMRVSDWGAATSTRPNAKWKKVENIPDEVFTLNTSTLSADPNWDWHYDTATGSARTDYTCVAQPGSYCPHLSPEAPKNQVMMVELAASPTNQNNSAFWFARNVVQRTMSFQNLSEISVPATIDMTDVPGEAHDVYLYVETKNMPAHDDKRRSLRGKAMITALNYANNPPPIPPQADQRDLRRNYSPAELKLMKKQGDYIEKAAAAAARQAEARRATLKEGTVTALSVPGMSGEQVLDEAWPTYRVHVSYDTGLTTKDDEDGALRPVLAPLSNFGFYLDHEGPLYGFKHRLEGVGDVKLESLGNDTYRVLDVAKDSKFQVTTVISAEEKPLRPIREDPDEVVEHPAHRHATVMPQHHGCGCSVPGSRGQAPWTFLALGALGFAAFARRRYGFRL